MAQTPLKSTSLRTRSEVIKAGLPTGLPTIDGSPSKPLRLSPRLGHSISINEERGPTPTKIPRLFPRLPGSPRSSLSQSTSYTGIAPTKSSRRLSYAGGISNEESEFGSSREPGLALGEKTLSTRRRQEGDLVPRAVIRPRDGTSASSSRNASHTPSRNASHTPSRNASYTPSAIDASPRGLLSASARLSSSTTESRRTPSRVTEVIPPRRTIALSSTLSSGLDAASEPSPIHTLAAMSKSRSMATGISKIARVPRSIVPAESTRSESASSRSHSASTTEEEVRGDGEMAAYVRRQQTKKLAAGMSIELIRKMFEFPEPTVPRQVLSARGQFSFSHQSFTRD